MTEIPKITCVQRCFIFNSKNQILILKRSLEDSRNPDKWEIPGGKLNKKETLEESLWREIKEEVGIDFEIVSKLNYILNHLINRGEYNERLYMVIFYIAKEIPDVIKLSEEHTECRWVSYEEMLNYNLTLETKKAAQVLEKENMISK